MAPHSCSGEATSNALRSSASSSQNCNGSPATRKLNQSELVSSVPNVPHEIRQKIIATCILSDVECTNRTHLTRMIPVISLVSRTWNAALISEPSAWTHLPELRHLIRISAKYRGAEEPLALLRMYLARSGSLPISWSISPPGNGKMPSFFAPPSADDEDTVIDALHLLIEHAERWHGVRLDLSTTQLVRLLSARGRLSLLSRLHLHLTPRIVYTFHGGRSLKGLPPRPDLPNDVVYLFADAPALRDVHLNMLSIQAARDSAFAKVVIELPWAQLERFSALVRTGPEVHYQRLVAAQSANLRVLEYTYKHAAHEEDPEAPDNRRMKTLPCLERLKLKAQTGHAPAHILDALVLPALVDLEIQSATLLSPPPSAYEQVQRMVERSGCEPRRLCLQHVWPAPGEVVSLLRCVSGSLEELGFCPAESQMEDVGCMILDLAGTETSLVPRLKRLVMCLEHSSDLDDLMDGKVIMDMINSRTRAFASLLPGSDSGQARQLEEVIMLHWGQGLCDEQVLLCEEVGIERYFENLLRTDGIIDGVPARDFLALAQRTRRDLSDKFFLGLSVMDHLNVKRQREMSALFRQLEKFDVEGACDAAKALFTTGRIPYLLCDITGKPDGWIPGDRMFSFRSRASKLHEKWNFTARWAAEEDEAALNGRWRHTEPRKAVFRWNPVRVAE